MYALRPDECRDYKCMWLQMEHAGSEVRPDRAHIIFDKMSDDVICALQDPDYELGRRAKGQINAFVKEGFSVGIIHRNTKQIARAKGHKFSEVAKVIDDRAKLHRGFN